MNRQELQAALSLLLDEMEGDQGDSHEIFLRLAQILSQMRAHGMPLPDDLVRLEAELAEDFKAESQSPGKDG